MKIAVIGAGSTYAPELINGFIERAASLPLSELSLMDINPQRLEIVGGSPIAFWRALPCPCRRGDVAVRNRRMKCPLFPPQRAQPGAQSGDELYSAE
jgi:hypothetical protein